MVTAASSSASETSTLEAGGLAGDQEFVDERLEGRLAEVGLLAGTFGGVGDLRDLAAGEVDAAVELAGEDEVVVDDGDDALDGDPVGRWGGQQPQAEEA
jgi:hypothetical protein